MNMLGTHFIFQKQKFCEAGRLVDYIPGETLPIMNRVLFQDSELAIQLEKLKRSKNELIRTITELKQRIIDFETQENEMIREVKYDMGKIHAVLSTIDSNK